VQHPDNGTRHRVSRIPFIGKAHANALARLPIFFPDVLVIERSILIGWSPEPLADAAGRLGFNAVETDWRTALEEIDVFYDLGPTHVYVEPTVAALEQDIPVLCKKPLAPRLASVETMAGAARESDATTATGFNCRCVPAFQLAKRMLDADEFGDIRRFWRRHLQNGRRTLTSSGSGVTTRKRPGLDHLAFRDRTRWTSLVGSLTPSNGATTRTRG